MKLTYKQKMEKLVIARNAREKMWNELKGSDNPQTKEQANYNMITYQAYDAVIKLFVYSSTWQL